MLQWSITFLVIALIAALFGFTGIMAVSVDIARILFVVFIALFVLTAVVHLFRGKSTGSLL
jgi:uncharacterized membrane protein YtjA (UPF0391 family)